MQIHIHRGKAKDAPAAFSRALSKLSAALSDLDEVAFSKPGKIATFTEEEVGKTEKAAKLILEAKRILGG